MRRDELPLVQFLSKTFLSRINDRKRIEHHPGRAEARPSVGKRESIMGLSTIFSGLISDANGPGGSIVKTGRGTLTLTRANAYIGGTILQTGSLVVTNTSGSATGTGAVSVTSGTLGGSGIIAGAVTVGTGSGSGAFLAPAHGGNKQLPLTIQSSLTFNSDATYTYTFKAKGSKSKTDKAVANGVIINGGASLT
jgi:fibronectin-binding autotransporter adhesin